MQKHTLKNGLTYYTVSTEELYRLGGVGVCDHCGTFHETGYLVPVLNHWLCKDCFEEWSKDARHYPEDDMYEEMSIKYYESKIPLI